MLLENKKINEAIEVVLDYSLKMEELEQGLKLKKTWWAKRTLIELL